MKTAPTVDKVTRSFAWSLTRQQDEGDSLRLEGYAAVFNTWTHIDSWEGSFNERIAPGAFAKTIKEHKPIMQFDHGTGYAGSLPIGVVQHLREDTRGLFVRARLSDNWLIHPIRDAIRDGAIDGMSFRFTVNKDDWTEAADGTPERTIREVGRLFELGPVVWPAYSETSVGVRSREIAAILAGDPDARADLARALTFGTFIDDIGGTTTTVATPVVDEVEEAAPDGTSAGKPPRRHLTDTERERMRARIRVAFKPFGG